MTKKLHHVGIMVNNLEESIEQYTKLLNATLWNKGIKDYKEVKCRMAHLHALGDITILLMESYDTEGDTRMGKFIKERGEGVFHLNIFTDTWDEDIKELKAKGVPVQVDDGEGLFDGFVIKEAWVPPTDAKGVWLELIDPMSVPPDERR